MRESEGRQQVFDRESENEGVGAVFSGEEVISAREIIARRFLEEMYSELEALREKRELLVKEIAHDDQTTGVKSGYGEVGE